MSPCSDVAAVLIMIIVTLFAGVQLLAGLNLVVERHCSRTWET